MQLKVIALSSMLAVPAFLLAAIVTMLFLSAVWAIYGATSPSEEGLRILVAWSVTAATVVLSLSVLIGGTALFAARLRLNRFAAISAAGLLWGLTLPFLLGYLTFFNGCGVNVSVPYPGTPACS
ncbi:MAG: hypothetical protein WEB52_12360 [Dehalococcoidia bacterium]